MTSTKVRQIAYHVAALLDRSIVIHHRRKTSLLPIYTQKGVPFMALISGGKDSLFNIAKCLAHGHELVAVANLHPPSDGPDELDSFMFQSAGATAIEALAECLGVPLFRAPMSGCSGHQGLHYVPTEGDEVEDLYRLIENVKVR